jgi:hypothetical protein
MTAGPWPCLRALRALPLSRAPGARPLTLVLGCPTATRGHQRKPEGPRRGATGGPRPVLALRCTKPAASKLKRALPAGRAPFARSYPWGESESADPSHPPAPGPAPAPDPLPPPKLPTAITSSARPLDAGAPLAGAPACAPAPPLLPPAPAPPALLRLARPEGSPPPPASPMEVASWRAMACVVAGGGGSLGARKGRDQRESKAAKGTPPSSPPFQPQPMPPLRPPRRPLCWPRWRRRCRRALSLAAGEAWKSTPHPMPPPSSLPPVHSGPAAASWAVAPTCRPRWRRRPRRACPPATARSTQI